MAPTNPPAFLALVGNTTFYLIYIIFGPFSLQVRIYISFTHTIQLVRFWFITDWICNRPSFALVWTFQGPFPSRSSTGLHRTSPSCLLLYTCRWLWNSLSPYVYPYNSSQTFYSWYISRLQVLHYDRLFTMLFKIVRVPGSGHIQFSCWVGLCLQY